MMPAPTNTPEPHDAGLAADMPLFLNRRHIVLGLGLVGVSAAAYSYLSAGEVNLVGTSADGAICLKDPVETSGPFPGDGTNTKDGQTVNALTQSGVVRQDIRPSFGAMSGVAEGVQFDLEITVVDVGVACKPLSGHAVYIWHADASGHYSLYDVVDQNYLRGVGVSDDQGRVKFTTVLPPCYDGRWPHIHFEVFATLDTAVSGDQSLLISQFALPQDVVSAVYAVDARYTGSSDKLAKVAIATDMVFGDNTAEQLKSQTLVLTGDATTGFSARGVIGIVA